MCVCERERKKCLTPLGYRSLQFKNRGQSWRGQFGSHQPVGVFKAVALDEVT